MLKNGIAAPLHFGNECRSEARLPLIEILGRFIKFTLGQFVKGDDHSRMPRLGVSENRFGRAAAARVGIPSRGSSFSFLCPHPGIFFVRQILKTVKEPLGQARPSLRLQPESLRFEFVDTHRADSTPVQEFRRCPRLVASLAEATPGRHLGVRRAGGHRDRTGPTWPSTQRAGSARISRLESAERALLP